MNKPGYATDKDKILKRLTRAEGQIRGIARMVAEDKYCIDVLTQISAAQAALDKTALELLRGHAKEYLTNDIQLNDDDKGQDREKQADELVNAVRRLLAR